MCFDEAAAKCPIKYSHTQKFDHFSWLIFLFLFFYFYFIVTCCSGSIEYYNLYHRMVFGFITFNRDIDKMAIKSLVHTICPTPRPRVAINNENEELWWFARYSTIDLWVTLFNWQDKISAIFCLLKFFVSLAKMELCNWKFRFSEDAKVSWSLWLVLPRVLHYFADYIIILGIYRIWSIIFSFSSSSAPRVFAKWTYRQQQKNVLILN